METFKNLFVSKLPPQYGDHELLAVFRNFSAPTSVAVMVDVRTGISKGFGFVLFPTEEAGRRAHGEMNRRRGTLPPHEQFNVYPSKHTGEGKVSHLNEQRLAAAKNAPNSGNPCRAAAPPINPPLPSLQPLAASNFPPPPNMRFLHISCIPASAPQDQLCQLIGAFGRLTSVSFRAQQTLLDAPPSGHGMQMITTKTGFQSWDVCTEFPSATSALDACSAFSNLMSAPPAAVHPVLTGLRRWLEEQQAAISVPLPSIVAWCSGAAEFGPAVSTTPDPVIASGSTTPSPLDNFLPQILGGAGADQPLRNLPSNGISQPQYQQPQQHQQQQQQQQQYQYPQYLQNETHQQPQYHQQHQAQGYQPQPQLQIDAQMQGRGDIITPQPSTPLVLGSTPMSQTSPAPRRGSSDGQFLRGLNNSISLDTAPSFGPEHSFPPSDPASLNSTTVTSRKIAPNASPPAPMGIAPPQHFLQQPQQ